MNERNRSTTRPERGRIRETTPEGQRFECSNRGLRRRPVRRLPFSALTRRSSKKASSAPATSKRAHRRNWKVKAIADSGVQFRRGVFFSSRRRHTRSLCDWSSDVCSSDLQLLLAIDTIDKKL